MIVRDGYRPANIAGQAPMPRIGASAGPERFDDVPPASIRREPPQARLKRLDEFLGEYEPLSYVLDPIVRTGYLYTVTASTGSGKTAWLISVALTLATGRRDVLGFEVEQGRVALFTFENPDDVRMRIMAACHFHRIDPRTIADQLVILDMRIGPEAALELLAEATRLAPFSMVMIDTFAAMYDGQNVIDPVEAGNFVRRIRPFTRLPGRPAALIAAHPVKNAPQDNLLPYGSGAILNEVDGNLTLWARSKGAGGISELHWQGKYRGLEFTPMTYRFDITSCPDVLDAKGAQILLPIMMPANLSEEDQEVKAKVDFDTNVALLKAMLADPKGSQRGWASAIDRSQSVTNAKLQKLKAEKLVEVVMGKWRLTARGEKEAAKWV